jgi:hypothetical protein
MKNIRLSSPIARVATTFALCTTLTASLASLGCGSSGSSSGGATTQSGSAPKISNLSIAPNTLTVNRAEMVQATFDFEDAEGDLSTLQASLKLSNGQVQAAPPISLAPLAGSKSGKAALAVQLVIPSAGPVEVTMTALDAAKNASNTLTVTLQAQ